MSHDALRHVKPACRAVGAYTLAAHRAPIKVNQNENPFDLPAELKQRVLQAAAERDWARYPDFDPGELLARLAEFAGWRPDGVLAGNGSNELIEATLLVSVGAGTRVVIPEPTFTLYGLMTTLLGGTQVPVPLAPDLSYDGDALLAARRAAAAPVTIVCSPNNPTGSLLAAEHVARLCDDADGLVVVDEAYHEFSGSTVAPLLHAHRNLIVLRTFSKAMGMAGLRVGYLLAAPELVREINKARLPYNVNFFSQLAALAALEAQDTLRARVALLVRERERLRGALAELPGVERVYPSAANFLLLELASARPRALFEALHERGILVRDVSGYPRLSRCLRVSVGTPEENDALLRAFGPAIEAVGAAPVAAARSI